MTMLTRKAVEELGLGVKFADRCRNFFAMGLVYWLYGRDLSATLRFIHEKFGNKPDIALANEKALRAGWNYGETTEAFASSFRVDPAKLPPGTYNNVMGNQAMAWGLVAAAELSGKELFLGSYPITPASDILHELSKFKQFGVRTFQAEDEIAAVCAAIGAAFGGAMAITTTSGPGVALKGEGIGLGVMLELPLIIVNVQRGGPSTGLPTKTEQSDLFQALYGRNGECPLPVIAAASPADCFDVALEAWRIAVRFMTPVMLLSDGYIANGSEPWRIPAVEDLPRMEIKHPTAAPGRHDDFCPTNGTSGWGVRGRCRGLRASCTASADWKSRIARAMSATTRTITKPWCVCGLRKSPTSPTTFRCRRSTGRIAAICWWSVGAGPSELARRPFAAARPRACPSATCTCGT